MFTPVNFGAAFSVAQGLPSTNLDYLPTPPREFTPRPNLVEGLSEPKEPDWNGPTKAANLLTLKVNFDPTRPENSQVRYSKDAVGRFEFTEAQRKLAALATPTKDLKDFSTKVSANYRKHFLAVNFQSYIFINSSLNS